MCTSPDSDTLPVSNRTDVRKVTLLAPAPPEAAAIAIPSPRPFRFIDLFAGIGGIRLGMEEAGGTCVYTVEIDRFARQTYAANFGEPEGGDIHEVKASDLPPYSVLAAGFPCQPFSIAGVSKKLSFGRGHVLATLSDNDIAALFDLHWGDGAAISMQIISGGTADRLIDGVPGRLSQARCATPDAGVGPTAAWGVSPPQGALP